MAEDQGRNLIISQTPQVSRKSSKFVTPNRRIVSIILYVFILKSKKVLKKQYWLSCKIDINKFIFILGKLSGKSPSWSAIGVGSITEEDEVGAEGVWGDDSATCCTIALVWCANGRRPIMRNKVRPAELWSEASGPAVHPADKTAAQAWNRESEVRSQKVIQIN